MAIVALTNSSSPVTVERATADGDPYERETQLNGLALNFDAHDHTSAKGLGVGRVQTSAAPAASGQVRANGDAWQWWAATAGAVRTAVDLEGAQTISGAKTFSTAVTVTPGAGQPSLVVPNWAIRHPVVTVFDIHYGGSADPNLHIDAGGDSWIIGTFRSFADNAWSCGTGAKRWTAVYAVNGAIQTSSQDLKEGITPLSPAECYQAAKDVVWYDYRYVPPAYTPPDPVDGETKEASEKALSESRAAHAKMLAETAPARHQRGFVYPAGPDTKDEAGGTLPPVPDLFGLDDRESTTPQADLATLGCALQEVIRRLEALEGAAA